MARDRQTEVMLDLSTQALKACGGLGVLANLPVEIRRQIWDMVFESGPLSASLFLQQEIYGCHTLTFHIGPHRIKRIVSGGTAAQVRACTTTIRVSADTMYYDQLLPALFAFDSPEPAGIQRYLSFPYSYLKAVRIVIQPPRRYCWPEHIRNFNSVVWLIDLLTNANHRMPARIEIDFANEPDNLWAHRSASRTPSFQGSMRRIPPFDIVTRQQSRSDVGILLRTLRRLPKTSRLVVTKPAYFESLVDWPAINAQIQELEGTIVEIQGAPLSGVTEAWKIRGEEKMLAAFYDMRACGVDDDDWLNLERLALWTVSYDLTVQARLDTLVLSDGQSRPSWVALARKHHQKQRILAKMYNPCGPAMFQICIRTETWRRLSSVLERYVRFRGAWSAKAWFDSALPCPIPRYGSTTFRTHRRYLISQINAGEHRETQCFPWPIGYLSATRQNSEGLQLPTCIRHSFDLALLYTLLDRQPNSKLLRDMKLRWSSLCVYDGSGWCFDFTVAAQLGIWIPSEPHGTQYNAFKYLDSAKSRLMTGTFERRGSRLYTVNDDMTMCVP